MPSLFVLCVFFEAVVFFTGGATISAVLEARKSAYLSVGTLARQRALLDGMFARVLEAIVLHDTGDRLLQVDPEFTRFSVLPRRKRVGV